MLRVTVAVLLVAFGATRVHGYAMGNAVALEELAKTADLVFKGTVVADRAVTDAWFEPYPSYEVRETELRVVAVVKGKPGVKRVRFRHYAYAPKPGVGGNYAPQSYRLAVGRSYLVFATKGDGDSYRQVTKDATDKADQGVLLAVDAKARRGKTVTDVAWAELTALLASKSPDDVVDAIGQLDELSGGRGTKLKDFARAAALDAIRPTIGAASEVIGTAAITVFGEDNPYADDRQAPFWLAGIGKGVIPGLAPRTVPATPEADVAVKELLGVVDGGASPELRALVIRTLGRSRAVPITRVEEWGRDPDPLIRAAGALASAELGDHAQITRSAADGTPAVRHAAARAAGFAQDLALLPLLDTMLKDPVPDVRATAALSLLAFSIIDVRSVLKANLKTEFRPLFVNALARRDAQPYLAMLAEVIDQRPQNWWSGTIPAADSWAILFDHIKGRTAAELGKLDSSLDALERMQWGGSSEPVSLYALYVRRGLGTRAKQFRERAQKAVSFDLEPYFDRVDKSPSTYAP